MENQANPRDEKISFDGAMEKAKKELGFLSFQNRSFITFVSVLVPLSVATWSLQSDIRINYPVVFWVALSVIAVMQIFVAWKLVQGPVLAHEFVHITHALEKQRDRISRHNLELKYEIKYFTAYHTASYPWAGMVRNYLKTGIALQEDLAEAIDEMFASILSGRVQFFRISDKELWNFAVYLFSESKGCLEPVWRQKAAGHPSKGKGRCWEPGQGHVGKAYADGISKITRDSQSPEMADLLRLPETLQREYDARTYRSYASIVIGPACEGAKPFGVLVATSDISERFDKGNSLILRHFAETLSAFIDMSAYKQ